MQHIAFIQNNNLLQYNALICNATQIYAHTYMYIYIQLRKTAQINYTYHLLHIPSNSHNIQPPQSTTVWKNTISTTKYRRKNPPPHNKKHNLTQNTAHRVTSRHHHYHTHAHNKTKQNTTQQNICQHTNCQPIYHTIIQYITTKAITSSNQVQFMQPSQSNNNIKTTIIQNIHTYATYRIYTKQQSTTIQCTHMQCNTNIRTHIHIYIHTVT